MKKIILLFLFVTIFMIGCVQNTNMYIWGNYSQTLYAYKKNPSQESLQSHINMLQKIIKTSEHYKKRVPPGIYAELAYMKKIQNPSTDVTDLLVKETTIYPESKQFIDFSSKTVLSEVTNVNE